MFDFLNSAILWALASVSIPVLIHFFARRKLRKIPFSSLYFLKSLKTHRIRIIRLRQILLLIFRSLAMLLLVLGFARPTCREYAVTGKNRVQKSVLVLMDNSASMNRDDLLEKAKERGLGILENMTAGDRCLLSAGSDIQGSRALFIGDGDRLKNRLSQIGHTYSHQNARDDINAALQLFDDNAFMQREMYYISDMQKTSFSITRDSLKSIPDNMLLFVLPVRGETENTAITGGQFVNPVFRAGMQVEYMAEISNRGDEPVTRSLVKAFWNDKAVSQQIISLNPGENKQIRMQWEPDEPGWGEGTIELEDDLFLDDNRRHFACDIPAQIRILLAGQSNKDVAPLQVLFESSVAGENPFDVTVLIMDEKPADIQGNFDSQDVVFLSNVSAFSSGFAAELIRFLKGGGRAFMALGPGIDLRNYQERILASLGNPVPGRRIGRNDAGVEDYLGLTKIDIHHPLFHGVFKTGQINVHSPRFYQVIEWGGGMQGETVMTLANNIPLLTDIPVGQGRLMLFSSGFDPRWSNLTVTSLFVPLIMRSALYLGTGSRNVSPVLTVGDRIGHEMEFEGGESVFHLETPAHEFIRVQPELRGNRCIFRMGLADMPGFYRLYRDDTLLHVFPVNLESAESDLHAWSQDELEANIAGKHIHIVGEGDSISEAAAAARWGREYWRWCLSAALLLLIAEALLGRAGKKEVPPGEPVSSRER